MRNRERAVRYAAGLYQWARDARALEKVARECAHVQNLLADKKVLGYLTHPLISRQDKNTLLQEMVSGLSPPLGNLLFLLAERNRLPLAPLVFAEFKQLGLREAGVKEAHVSSAVELSGLQKKALRDALQRRFKTKIRLYSRVDKTLLGGVMARVGDSILDASVAGSLSQAAEKLRQP
jgi:F-type H+-transporting ATPase subunit delta